MSADEAQQLRRMALQYPGDASLRRRLGNVLQALGDMHGAEAAYRESLALEPGSVRGHNNLGQVLLALGDRDGAMASYQRAIALDGHYAIAHNNLGILHFDAGRYDQAVACYQRALESMPQFAQAHHNCGNALMRLRRVEAALTHYDQALALMPGHAETLNARGKALQQLERFEEALDCYDQALATVPDHAEALSNSASVLLSLKRLDEALERSERALAADPRLAAAHSNRAGALRGMNRLAAAREACEQALQLNPEFAEAWSNLGNVLVAQGRLEAAFECFDRALGLQPDLISALEQQAALLPRERRLDDAIRAYEALQKLKPTHKFLPGSLRYTRNLACSWQGHDEDLRRVAQGVDQGQPVVPPFILLSLSDSPALQLRCAVDYAAQELLPGAPEQELQRRSGPPHERLRVAYLSADFHHHATAMLMAGLFERHDHGRFEITAVSFGTDDGSALRQRLNRAFDRFLDVRETGDAEVVSMLREMEIDIAVDLKGYTGDMRPGLFARRCAPIQVSFIGFPGTLGLPQMDYIIADRIVLPPEHAPHYSEKVVWLPDSYQCNDDQRQISDRVPSREEAGLPASGFVFCCFNNNYKITPEVFDVWMRLLRAVPGSVLWLLGDNEAAIRNLKQEAQLRGVAAERLVFAARAEISDHLARHRLADLFLDTLIYNAHTTASDALWAGVPVLTRLGNAFAGRVGASLLHAMGMPELVTRDLAEYEARALALAQNPARLAALKQKLARNRLTHPLFDTKRFTRHLERAYEEMWRRHVEGLAPESFEVEAYS